MAKGLFMRYQSYRPKRQFLAGVRCHGCQALDSTVQVQIFEPAFDEYIECTLCGHSERRPSAEDLVVMQTKNTSESLVKFITPHKK